MDTPVFDTLHAEFERKRPRIDITAIMARPPFSIEESNRRFYKGYRSPSTFKSADGERTLNRIITDAETNYRRMTGSGRQPKSASSAS